MQEIRARSQIKFERAYLHDFWDEAIALTKLNHQETGVMSVEEFAPNKAKYLEIEKLGFITTFTFRCAGELVGYCLMFVSNHLHYPSTLWAVQDTLFVRKDHRGLSAARFLIWVDAWLKEYGVSVVMRQVTERLDFSRSLKRMGYTAIETGYMRRFN